MKFLFLSSYAHLVLNPASSRVSGGAELQVALLARELVCRGHEVVIVGGDIGQVDGETFDGVRTRTGGKFHTGGFIDLLEALPRVFQVIRQERPDWIFILGWTTWLFFLHVLKPFFKAKLGFICGLDTEVNGEFRRENPLRGALFEYAMRRCDVRFAMTNLQERFFREQGMDCALYRNLLLPRRTPRQVEKNIDFLWVARCQPIKQPHIFLNLVERLPEARFEMICPCENEELWRSVSSRARTLPNLIFHDGVPYHEVQEHYDTARVFVNTSTYEGWPNSFIQAGLGHTGILSLQVRPDNLFDDYQLGACADGNEGVLMEAARHCLQDAGLTARMGGEAARFVAEMHDNSRETDAFLAGLKTLPAKR